MWDDRKSPTRTPTLDIRKRHSISPLIESAFCRRDRCGTSYRKSDWLYIKLTVPQPMRPNVGTQSKSLLQVSCAAMKYCNVVAL